MINAFPVLSRYFHLSDERFQAIQDKSIKYLLAMSLPVAAGLLVSARQIISLLYGPGFDSSVAMLQILAWNLPLHALWAVLWRVLAARGRQDLVLRVEVISTFVRIGGGFVLISWFGPLGAALTLPIISLLHTILLANYIKQAGTQLHFFRLSWRLAVAALAMGVLTWLFGRQLQLWALVPMAVAIYAFLIFLFRAFSPDDFALFRKVWQSGMAGRS
jgi:O-antigen/teichoic acid export membrane protein